MIRAIINISSVWNDLKVSVTLSIYSHQLNENISLCVYLVMCNIDVLIPHHFVQNSCTMFSFNLKLSIKCAKEFKEQLSFEFLWSKITVNGLKLFEWARENKSIRSSVGIVAVNLSRKNSNIIQHLATQ